MEIIKIHQTSFTLEMGQSEVWRWKNPFGINGLKSQLQLTQFFFQSKNTDNFLNPPQKYKLWVLIRRASNGYPQHVFSWRNKKKYCGYPPLICSYVMGKKCLVHFVRYMLFTFDCFVQKMETLRIRCYFATMLFILGLAPWVKKSADILIFFSYFPRKTGFDISFKLSPLGTICMRCQILSSGKNKKNITNLSSVELSQRMVMVKYIFSKITRLMFQQFWSINECNKVNILVQRLKRMEVRQFWIWLTWQKKHLVLLLTFIAIFVHEKWLSVTKWSS